jgi:hypothetical protein
VRRLGGILLSCRTVDLTHILEIEGFNDGKE